MNGWHCVCGSFNFVTNTVCGRCRGKRTETAKNRGNSPQPDAAPVTRPHKKEQLQHG